MPNLTVLSKRQMCLSSTRSRHPSVDGDCVFRPGTTAASLHHGFIQHHQASWIRQPPDRYRAALRACRLGQTIAVQGDRSDDNEALDDILPNIRHASQDESVG